KVFALAARRADPVVGSSDQEPHGVPQVVSVHLHLADRQVVARDLQVRGARHRGPRGPLVHVVPVRLLRGLHGQVQRRALLGEVVPEVPYLLPPDLPARQWAVAAVEVAAVVEADNKNTKFRSASVCTTDWLTFFIKTKLQ